MSAALIARVRADVDAARRRPDARRGVVLIAADVLALCDVAEQATARAARLDATLDVVAELVVVVEHETAELVGLSIAGHGAERVEPHTTRREALEAQIEEARR